MTNSRSTASRSSRALRIVAVVVAVLASWIGTSGVASAGRKRIAVLPFDGDGAEKIQADVVKMIKRSHTVITADKWNEAAESLKATKVNDKNLKKIARKLKVDGIVTGSVEKRRSEYIIRIKLRAGTTGALVGDPVNTKTSSTRLDGTAQTDLKDELLEPIGALEQNRGGGGEEAANDGDDDDEEEVARPAPVVKGPKKGFSTHKEREQEPAASDEDDDEKEENPLPKKRPAKVTAKPKPTPKKHDDDDDGDGDRRGKRVAAATDEDEGETGEGDDRRGRVRKHRDDDEGGDATDDEVALSPGERAIDAVIGLSFNARRLGFKFDADLATKPSGYAGAPVGGFVVDAGIYPGAFTHRRGGIAENIGASFLYDKVFTVSTKDRAGMKYDSSENRFAIGVIARYPVAKGVVGGMLRYGKQTFTIASGAPVPSVAYSFINPGVFARYPATPKVLLNASFGIMGIVGTGDIQNQSEYGGASVLGLDFDVGGDYKLTKSVFARAAIKVQTYGYKFKGTGDKTTDLDNDMDVDVQGARDTYIGGAVNIGVLY